MIRIDEERIALERQAKRNSITASLIDNAFKVEAAKQVTSSKMFTNFEAYKEMLLDEGFSSDFLKEQESFIKKSFDLDVNILELTESLKSKQSTVESVSLEPEPNYEPDTNLTTKPDPRKKFRDEDDDEGSDDDDDLFEVTWLKNPIPYKQFEKIVDYYADKYVKAKIRWFDKLGGEGQVRLEEGPLKDFSVFVHGSAVGGDVYHGQGTDFELKQNMPVEVLLLIDSTILQVSRLEMVGVNKMEAGTEELEMTTKELQDLLKFLRDTVAAIENEQETPERLEERAEALDTITDIEQELLKRGIATEAGVEEVMSASSSDLPDFNSFCEYMFTQCKTEIPFASWKKKNLENLKSLYQDFLKDMKKSKSGLEADAAMSPKEKDLRYGPVVKSFASKSNPSKKYEVRKSKAGQRKYCHTDAVGGKVASETQEKVMAGASPREIKDILIALNATGDMGFKYPIGNKELTEKIKKFEAEGLISYDAKFGKWSKGAKSAVQAGEDKKATFSKKFKQLTYWTSKNTSTSVNCDNAEKAKKIIEMSKVPQKLVITAATKEVEPEETEWQDQTPGGIGDDKTPGDFDIAALIEGISVEMEHTDDVHLAAEIAMDHLSEDMEYYTKLAEMEHPEGESPEGEGEVEENKTEASVFKYKNKKSQENALKEFFIWMYEGRIENDQNDPDYDPQWIGEEVEDQLTGVSGTVNGKKTDDIYEELIKNLSESEIEAIADSLPFNMEIRDGWAYYYGNEYKEAVGKGSKTEAAASVEPAVYVGTYGKYGSGSIKGAWMKLSDYDSKEEFMEAAKELHKDESDPELMFQDYEGFPEKYYNEGGLPEELWDWLALDEEERDVLAAYVSLVGAEYATPEKAQEAFAGKYDSKEDWAIEFIESTGGLSPKTAAYYIEISDTDRRLIAQEDADSRVEDMSEDDVIRDADMETEYEAAEDDEAKDKILDKAKEALKEKYSDEVEEALKDPVGYFVDEHGMYSIEELIKASFISIDYDSFASDSELNGDISFSEVDGQFYAFYDI